MSDTIDINVFETTEQVSINATPTIVEVNINRVTSTGAVTSVNGQQGDVVLDADDIAESATRIWYNEIEQAKLATISEGAEVNVNADWNASSGDALILNKPSSLPPNGIAGGDLQGSYPDPVVHQIQGQSVQNGNPANKDVLIWDNTAQMWKHRQIMTTDITDSDGYHLVTTAQQTIINNTSGTNTGDETNTSIITKIGFTPENSANKSTALDSDKTSNLKYSTPKSIYDWATALFATKSMSAYSFRVNNTNATANATETIYRSQTKQSLSTGITWSGTTAPTGLSGSYEWLQIGNVVNYNITLFYTNAGTLLTQVAITLPSDMPTPLKPDGLTNASDELYTANGRMLGSSTLGSVVNTSAGLRSNSANNGFEFVIIQGAGAFKVAKITGQYYTA